MSVNFYRLSGRITSRYSHAFFVLALLVITLATQPAGAQEKKMVSLENVSAEKAFKELSGLYKVRFFYAGSSIRKNEKISIPAGAKTLEEVLQFLEQHYRYAFRRNDNMISVSIAPPPATIAEEERSIRGRIGLYEGDVIAYRAGVTVREQGTTNATVTDDKGNFSLKLKTVEGRLVISCIGYESNEITVADKTMVNITLKPALKNIAEVVVSTGYQTLALKNTTGAYATISAKEIERRSSQSLTGLLEGSIPGLTLATSYVGSSKSRQQNGFDIQVRGGSAMQSGRNSPLIIVDGLPVNSLPDNLNDVAKVDVLKDAAAAAIWGARASNGVIVITTKRGREGKLKINYANNTYFTQRPDYSQLRRAGSADMIDYDKELYDKGFIEPLIFDGGRTGYSPSFDILFQLNKGLITDAEFRRKQDSLSALSNSSQVRDLLLRTGVRQNHYLSLSGGGQGYRFLVSGSYDQGKSVYIGDKSQSAQLNTRSDFQVSRNLRFNVDLNGTFQENKTGTEPGSGIQQLPPYQLLLDANGRYLYDYTTFNKTENDRLIPLGYADNGRNLLEEARLSNNRTKNFGLRTNIGGEWRIVKGLSLNATFLYDRFKTSGRNLIPQASYENRSYINQFTTLEAGNKAVYNLPVGDELYLRENTNNNWGLRGQLNYSNTFLTKHFVNLAAGLELKKYVTDGFTNTKFGYNDDLQSWQPIDQQRLLKGGLTWWDGSQVPIYDATQNDVFSHDDVREQSMYATGAYTYDERITATGSFRVDQSNLFGADPKYRRTPLWSAGLAWDIARESFFHIPAVSMLKLRATIGLTGNFDRSTTPLLVATRRYQATLNDFAARVNSYNPKLRWERTRSINLGMDLAMLEGRLQITADYYNKQGYDLLGNLVLDPTVGFTNMRINGAKMTNKGIEMALQGDIIARRFKWNSRLNIAYNKNRITDNKVPESDPVIARPMGTSQYLEGYSRESLWSYRWAGLDDHGNPQTYNEKDEKVKIPVFASLIHSGSYRAPLSGGFTNIVSYKGIFASIFATFNFGNVLRREMPSMYGYEFGNNQNYQIRDRWRKPGDELRTDIAAITPSFDPSDFYDGRERVMQYSSNSIMPGDYIRLREVQLGYNLPASLLRGSVFKAVNFIAQMNNIALWKKNKYGIDPEAIDPVFGTYYLPAPRITTFTIRVEL